MQIAEAGGVSHLTINLKGQVMLRRELLRYLRVLPGDAILVRMLPGGRIELSAAETEKRQI